MGNSHMKQHFENARKTGVIKISSSKLKEFPPQLKHLNDVLRSLDLSDNKFDTLPSDISHFTHLKHLNISYNRLFSLPNEIGLLIKLETLNANNNLISALPNSLSKLKNLKQVTLSDNQLETFPTMLCGLKHLDSLDLTRNKISVIPNEASKLYVMELILNQNEISHISDAIADCPRLKTLRLEENCLTADQIHSKILIESKISTLCLDGNLFDNKQLQNIEGYENYMERYTAVKKKMF
uniref:Putative leucine-rich repeat protein n=1 Tax=Xenopsylla cheopis TaxID=163159 RepID=A0A6M2DLG2_XENCH